MGGGLRQEADIWIKHSGQRSEPCGTQALFQAENTMVQRQERFDIIWVWTWHLNKIFETIQQKPKVSQSFEQVRSSSHYLQRVNSFQLSTWDPDNEVLLTGSMGTSGVWEAEPPSLPTLWYKVTVNETTAPVSSGWNLTYLYPTVLRNSTDGLVMWLLPLLNFWDTRPSRPSMGTADNLCCSHAAASVCRWHVSSGPFPTRSGEGGGGPGPALQTQHRGRNWDEAGRSTSYSISLHKWDSTEFQIIISSTDLKAVSEFCLLGRLIVWVSKKTEIKKELHASRGKLSKRDPEIQVLLTGLSSCVHHCSLLEGASKPLPKALLK